MKGERFYMEDRQGFFNINKLIFEFKRAFESFHRRRRQPLTISQDDFCFISCWKTGKTFKVIINIPAPVPFVSIQLECIARYNKLFRSSSIIELFYFSDAGCRQSKSSFIRPSHPHFGPHSIVTVSRPRRVKLPDSSHPRSSSIAQHKSKQVSDDAFKILQIIESFFIVFSKTNMFHYCSIH